MTLNQQRSERFIKMANEILEEISIQRSIDESLRPSKVGNGNLESMRQTIEKCVESVEVGSLPRKESRYRTMSRMVIDSWPLGAELGKRISELDDLYLALD